MIYINIYCWAFIINSKMNKLETTCICTNENNVRINDSHTTNIIFSLEFLLKRKS